MRGRPRLLVLAAGLVVSLALGALYVRSPTLLTRIDLSVYDLFLRRMHDGRTSGRVVIVDIDEASLSEFGRWPWPRARLARLLEGIHAQGATAVGLAILLPEPEDPAGDQALADVLRGRHVVAGYAFTFTTDGVGRNRCALHPVRPAALDEMGVGITTEGLFRATGVVCSIPIVAEAAAGAGFVNAAPDGDGIFRRVPQLIEYAGRAYPSLALALLMQVLDARHVTLVGAHSGNHSLRVGEVSVPLDAWGTLLLHFRGGARAFQYVSAGEVLGGRLPPQSLRGKIVFLDTSALGIRKVLATPLDPLLPAVEVHATIVDNVLRGDALVRPAWASVLEMTLVLVLGAGSAWLLVRMRSGGAGVLVGGAVLVLWVASAWLFLSFNVVISPLFPTLALAASLTVVTMLNLTIERRRAAQSLRAADELSAQVDERRRREEAAREANRAKSEFLARMSHELRTPLNAILGFGQLLEMDAVTPEQQEGAEQIVRAGRHLLSLIDEVLDISRIEAGRLLLSPEPVGVADAVLRCLGLVGPLAQARGIELRAADLDDRWYVEADPKRLDQVLLNVLSNAVKYNRDNGTVSVALDGSAAGRLRLHIADTGHGIAPDKLPLLFTPFERLGAEHGGVEGTGLGLALSKQLVEAMGGSMQAASVVGQGTTFTLELGLADRPAPDAHGSAGEARAGPNQSATPITVLCIEDDASSLRLVETIVARRPGTVMVSAGKGRIGLALAREHQPDIVLLDRQLPDMAGDEVLRELLEDPRTKHIGVVLLSANANPADVERLLAAGGRAYLTKPLDVTDLMALLDEAAAKRAR